MNEIDRNDKAPNEKDERSLQQKAKDAGVFDHLEDDKSPELIAGAIVFLMFLIKAAVIGSFLYLIAKIIF